MVKVRVGCGLGVPQLELVLLASVIALVGSQLYFHRQLKVYVDELLENVKIPLGGMANISEAQIDAAKQDRLFGFLQMLMQPQIQVQEVERSEAGQFKKH